jgi:ATP-dependent helicase/nuclease subunit A
MAILTRANQSTAELQAALDEFDIPSLVIGGLTFFDTREVRDLKLLLDVLANPRNEVSLAGLLRSPLIGYTDDDLLRMKTTHRSISEGVRKNPPPYWDTLEDLRAIRNSVSPDRLLQRVIDERDYESTLTDRARANIEKFLSTLRRLHERHPGNLAAIAAELEQSAPEAEAPPEQFVDAVQLMTIHKAKGLEFPIVFLPYLHKCGSNDYPVISYTVEHGLGIKWRDPQSNDGLSDAIRDRNKEIANAARKAEDDRLLYVAMSRAMEHLVLSWTRTPRQRSDSWASLVEKTLDLSLEGGVRLHVTDTQPEIIAAVSGGTAQSSREVLDRAAPADLYESAISATDVSRFIECPRKYYLSRYIKWDLSTRRIEIADEDDLPPARDELDASELGTQVHELLAGKDVSTPDAEAVKLAQRFRDSELGRAAERARSRHHEWDFVMAIQDVVVRGQIDLWFDDGRSIVLVDYKTDRVSTSIQPEDIIGYQLQLQIYAEALLRRTGRRPSRAVLHFLRSNTVVDVDVSPLACSHALDSIRELREAQEQLDFITRKGEHCRHCDFAKGWCPQSATAGAAFGATD